MKIRSTMETHRRQRRRKTPRKQERKDDYFGGEEENAQHKHEQAPIMVHPLIEQVSLQRRSRQ